MKDEQRDNEIVHRWQGGQSLRGIARDLSLSRWQVSRAVREHQAARAEGPVDASNSALPAAPESRGSKLDVFESTIGELLKRYPQMTATRIFEELKKQGYQGGYTIIRERIKQLRSQPKKTLVERFETAPGAQAQMDWAEYQIDFAQEGRRRVNLFSYVLGYSRRQYLCFTERQDFETTVGQHILAFRHLQGLATTCLYDNMKVVVTRWEDEHPIYNTRFLSFATHYGYRPWACRPRRPQTKGKVERPFHYVETSLLNGRSFRSLEHLNEVTRWWLANVADVRTHRTTKKRPLDSHAEELPHLLPLPLRDYDTARVVYRVVDVEGMINYANNQYSAPWRLVGEVLPVRVTETELFIYDRHIRQLAQHQLLVGQSGQQRVDPAHRPPRDHGEQVLLLRQRFAELGDVASRFLEGLLKKQRCGKRQAQRVLLLLHAYHRDDIVAAMDRAVRYHAYALSSLERILSMQATPKASWQSVSEHQQESLQELSEAESIGPRSSAEYQYLLFEENDSDDRPQERQLDPPPADSRTPGDTEDPIDE
ncbi:MAG: IS21 family transposase [Pirellulaceae bacterium]|mgnify:CR=1 FL=1|jgi:transposase|nr:IS21 family transposase [Pirellulaceae bacterium]